MKSWDDVAVHIQEYCRRGSKLSEGQRRGLLAIAKRLTKHGVLLCDEVGMGKTRIAVAVAQAVSECGGRVAIIVPTGLGAQWQDEFGVRGLGLDSPKIIRSLDDFYQGLEEWPNRKILLVSHTFTFWRYEKTARAWRYTLLPAILGMWRKENGERLPNGYKTLFQKVYDNAPKPEARERYENIAKRYIGNKRDKTAQARLMSIIKNVAWQRDLFDPEQYQTNKPYREPLLQCVGLCLGGFDLVIIDEAHKNRGAEGNLERCLETMLMRSKVSRALGLTATPIELDTSQWTSILERIGAGEETGEQAAKIAEAYVEAVWNLQGGVWKVAPDRVASFIDHAKKFQTFFSPWIVRRTKAEEEVVQNFRQLADTRDVYSYITQVEEIVRFETLSPRWQKVICACEALSLTADYKEDREAKNLRFTVGSGYGIATLIDTFGLQTNSNEEKKKRQEILKDMKADTNGAATDWRLAHVQAWKDVIRESLGDETSDTVLYEHPAICKAVECIETITGSNEKVLVFGTYLKPLTALTEMLNARHILQSLRSKSFIPLETVPEQLRDALETVLAGEKMACSPDDIDRQLKKQYGRYRRQLATFRKQVKDCLDRRQRLEEKSFLNALLDALLDSSSQHDENGPFFHIARGLEEILGEKILAPMKDADILEATGALFNQLCTSSDKGEADYKEEGEENLAGLETLTRLLKNRLEQEFSTPRATFARLIYGDTAHHGRRTAQLAFNRKDSRLRVLVAQSLVGREGLNLHEACRHVLLLHPEWNPGVVEQQIGRVDRMGSYWEKLLRNHNEGEIPKIVLHCIIFSNTYDEEHWNVLNRRRRMLRAQFFGEVVTTGEGEELSPENQLVLESIRKATPSFSPS